MSRLKLGSLCTGYGGLDQAVDALLGTETVWLAEFDPHAAKVCAARFPGVPNLHDITAVNWAAVEPIELLTAGYPCQPFSGAGLRKGTDDPRHLWPHIARAISVLRPRLVVLENVAGHLSLGFDSVLGDLAELGFDAEWCLVRASDVGACHQRKRLFVVATDATHERSKGAWRPRDRRPESADLGVTTPDAEGERRGQGRRPGAVEGPEVAARSSIEAGRRCDALPADARRQRHGRGQDGGVVGRVDRQDAGGPRERQRPRTFAGDRSATAPADAHDIGREGTVTGPRWDDLGSDPGPAPDPERDGRSQCHDAGGREGLGAEGREPARAHPAVAWGDYGPAIRRHEHLTGRPAPSPVDTKGRLCPIFVEWMMCLPDGWVTDLLRADVDPRPEHLSRAQALKILGNGVVPPQAAYAIAHLLEREAVAA